MKEPKTSFAYNFGWAMLPLLLILFYGCVLRPSVLVLIPLPTLALGVCLFAVLLALLALGIYFGSSSQLVKQAARDVAIGSPLAVFCLWLLTLVLTEMMRHV
jgi:hypothetical protein